MSKCLNEGSTLLKSFTHNHIVYLGIDYKWGMVMSKLTIWPINKSMVHGENNCSIFDRKVGKVEASLGLVSFILTNSFVGLHTSLGKK